MDSKKFRITTISNVLLVTSAHAAADEVGKFTGWLVAGLGGALAFFIGSNGAGELFESGALRGAAMLFLVLLVAEGLRRLAAVDIAVKATGAATGARLAKEWREEGRQIQNEELFSALERCVEVTPWPLRWHMRMQMAGIQSGNLDGSGRIAHRLAHWVMLLALIELILAGAIVAKLALNLKGLAT